MQSGTTCRFTCLSRDSGLRWTGWRSSDFAVGEERVYGQPQPPRSRNYCASALVDFGSGCTFLMFAGAIAAEPDRSSTYQAHHSVNGMFDQLAENRPPLQAYENYDLTGPNSRTLPGVDLQACSAACQADGQCQAFSYDKWRQECFLKETIGSFRFEPRSVSGIAANSALLPMSNQRSCENDKDCVAFTHSETRQVCKLFQTTETVVTDESVVSGIKRQRARSGEKSDSTNRIFCQRQDSSRARCLYMPAIMAGKTITMSEEQRLTAAGFTNIQNLNRGVNFPYADILAGKNGQ